MLKVLFVIGGLILFVLAGFYGYFALIIYKDDDGGGYKNTPIEWLREHHKDWRNWAHLNFDEWKKYYILAPYEWYLLWFAPKRMVKTKNNGLDAVYINFGFIGNIRYIFYKYNMKNKRKKSENFQKSQDSLRYILEAVQGDIEKIQKKAEEETNKAKKEIEKVRDSYMKSDIELKSTDRWEN